MLGAPGNISASSIEALSAEHHAICALTHPKKGLEGYGSEVTFYFGDRDNPADLAHRSSGICGRDSGGHSDRPDADAALIRQEAFAMDKGRYSIIFSSLTGNTKILAETIRAVLPAENCDYYGVPETQELHSEILYIGFWTDKGNADNATLELLSKLRGKKVFLFGTAGFGGSVAYFQKILDHVKQSVDPSNTVVGEYMCQGKMPQSVRDRYMKMKAQPEHPANIDALIENFDRALSHPDEDDLERLRKIILG